MEKGKNNNTFKKRENLILKERLLNIIFWTLKAKKSYVPFNCFILTGNPEKAQKSTNINKFVYFFLLKYIFILFIKKNNLKFMMY